jgi:hypothetical protein
LCMRGADQEIRRIGRYVWRRYEIEMLKTQHETQRRPVSDAPSVIPSIPRHVATATMSL